MKVSRGFICSIQRAAIDNEDHFLRRGLLRRDTIRRLEEEHEESAACVAMYENRVADVYRGHGVLKDEIAVGNVLPLPELDDGAMRRGTLDVHLVQFGLNIVNRQTGVDVDFDRDVVAGPRALGGDRRCDARRVGNLARARNAAFERIRCHRAGDVARSDDHRKCEAIQSVAEGQTLDVRDLDFDPVARKDIRDGLCEDVWTLLIEQTRGFARLARRVVDALCFLARFDDPFHHAAADVHGHRVDRCILRKRECIHGLDGCAEGIPKLLGDGHAGDEPGDVRDGVRVLQRACAERSVVAVHGVQAAFRGRCREGGVREQK
ncbi:MAG: hypothetical protein NTU83_03645 [Candidatus Hydrogenedentes bacterium]|nr:hypothetical protein [Candidatus Hydrogenedentota bacterium]